VLRRVPGGVALPLRGIYMTMTRAPTFTLS
jgi:hypothetical protein